MSLRSKLFLLVGGLLVATVLAQAWLARSLVRDVAGHVSEAAFVVGEALVTAFAAQPAAGAGAFPDGGSVRLDLVAGDDPDETYAIRLQGQGLDTRVAVPQAGVAAAVATFRKRTITGGAAVLAAGLALAALLAHRVTVPVRELAAAARAVDAGGFGAQAAVEARGEVGEAVAAFNRMSAHLATLEAEAATARAREHLAELGEVARGLAHGLRNPLNALGLTLEELALGGPPRPELAEAARRQIQRVDQALRSFLALASSEASSSPDAVDVAALAEDVVLEVQQDTRGRVVLDVRAEPGLPALKGFAAEIRAAVQALVVNAAEASPDGAAVVLAIARDGDDGVRITVTDSGPGLPEPVRARLFRPHVTTKATGSGMGLYVAHRIAVDRHGGSLELRPRDGAPGTVAVLRLRPARLAGGV